MPTIAIQPTPKGDRLTRLGGLNVEGGTFARDKNTFSRLENFDLTRDGTIRKSRGFEALNDRSYSAPIVAIRTYVREPLNDANPRLVGFAQDGRIYDLNTGANIGIITQPLGFPFVAALPTFSSDSDVDPDGAVVNQFYIVPEGGYVARWDGKTIVAPVGVSAPTSTARVEGIAYIDVEEDNAGNHAFITIEVSRRYAWTWWNPEIRHESSMSPTGFESTVGEGGYNLSNAGWYLAIRVGFTELATTYGGGYLRRRLWVTQDGGAEFFLVEELYDDDGNLVTDEDGSFPATMDHVYDGKVLWAVIASPAMKSFGAVDYPFALDQALARSPWANLVTPADTTVGSNDPPPHAVMGIVYQNRLWLVPEAEQNKLVFSKAGEFSSFPVDNFFYFLSEDADPITCLAQEFASLIVGRKKKLSRVTGTDFTDFAVTHLDQGLGILGKRLSANGPGKLFYLSQKGLYSYAMDLPKYESMPLRPVFERINMEETSRRMMMAQDSRNEVLYFGLVTGAFHPEGFNEDVLVGMDYSSVSPFFILRTGELLNQLFCLDSVELNDEQVLIAGMGNRKVYVLNRGSGFFDAFAEFQQYAGDDMVKRKTFRYVLVEDDPDDKLMTLNGFMVSFSVDGGPFRAEQPLRRHTPIGLTGRYIKVRLRHRDQFFYDIGEKWPTLSNLTIEYIELGEAY